MTHLPGWKRVAMVGCSLIYASVRALLVWGCRLWGRQPRPARVVLYYHTIDSRRQQEFAWQVQQLAAMTQCAGPALCRVVVTFDDAFGEIADDAVPQLRRHAVPCMIFVPTGYIGQQAGWLPEGRQRRVMTAKELRQCQESGVMLGSHTHSHPHLSMLDDTELDYELRVSRQILAQLTGAEITALAFPHGDYDARVVRRAREVGYTSLYGIVPGDRSGVSGRVAADAADWRLEFYLKIRGAYAWFGWASQLKRRLRRC